MKKKILLALFIFGFLIRLAYVLNLSTEIRYDELDYDNLAWNIAKGAGYINTERIWAGHLAARPPGYPLFLAAVYFLFGHSIMTVRFMQAVISSLLIVLIYIIGKEVFSERVARVAAILATIYPFFIYYAGSLQSELLCSFYLALAVLYGSRFLKSPILKNAVLFGIFIGLTGLTRPVFILYGSFIIFALIANKDFNLRKALKLWLLVLAVVAVTFLPWVIRNYLRLGAFIPGTTLAGEVLYVSAHPTADGSPGPNLYDEELVKIRQQIKGEVSQDRYFHRKAVSFIIDNPMHYAWLIGKRFLKIWNILPDTTQRDRLFSLFSFGILLPFFILGFIRAVLRNEAIMPAITIFYVSLVLPVLFYGSTRLRFPIESFILLFAASGITLSWSCFREQISKKIKKLVEKKAYTMLQQGKSAIRSPGY